MLLPVQLRKRRPDTHKGDYGRVLVVGGSPGLTGAPCLCARAALRAGAGLVTVAVPRSLHDIFEVKLTEVMSVALPDVRGFLSQKAVVPFQKAAAKMNVAALGCGASRNKETQSFSRSVIATTSVPLVVDADGINALAGHTSILRTRKSSTCILTPHVGEFARLTGKSAAAITKRRKELVKEFAFQYNLVLVLKGSHTLISDGTKIFENKTGNPGMATAGTGDVLTGIIAGFLAQGIAPLEAACVSVEVHGLAGDIAAKEKTQTCLIASDIIDCLPQAIKKMKYAPR